MPRTLAEEHAVAQVAVDRLELRSDPSAAGRARAWLKAQLSDWSPAGVEAVQLLVSELVTNAVLHTDDPVEVTATRSGSRVTVEVADRNPSQPVVKSYGQDAATGRGLRLVEALADAWGVRGDETRKAVWFRIVDGARKRTTTLAAGDVGVHGLEEWSGPSAAPAPSPPGSVGGPEVEVCLIGLPVATYFAVQEHHDALMREFALLVQTGLDDDPPVPARLMELASTLGAQFGSGNDQRRAQVEAARRAGHANVDVAMMFPVAAEESVLRTAAELDEVDDYCRRGQLLTRPSTPAIHRFRQWYTEEIIHQLQGRPPSPWPYGDDSADVAATQGDRR
jgi:anti-sigma regulatory factor (Ser/Thr protein kinase)